MKFIDITGMKFGMWTVIERAKNDKYNLTRWICKCDCGNEAVVNGNSLKRGGSKGCGCSRYKEMRKEEIEKRYGKLVVIRGSHVSEDKRMMYLCKCDCGNELITRIDSLKRGTTVSCGCISKEKARENQRKMVNIGRFKGTKVQNLNNNISSTNTSGYKGIRRAKKNGEERGWIVRIGIKNERKYIGYFINLEDAIAARKEAEEKYYKPIIEEYEKGGQINE
ncbi:MAG: hypothetical protein RR967_07825 [Anaerovoracaceae bacterium]